MKTEYSLKMYAEIMAHILTIEEILTATENIKEKDYNKILEFNRADIKKQLNLE